MLKYLFSVLLSCVLAISMASDVQAKNKRNDKSKGSTVSVKSKGAVKNKATVQKRVKNKLRAKTLKNKAVTSRGKAMKVGYAVRDSKTMGDLAGLGRTYDPLDLSSNVAFVMDQSTAQVLFEKNSRFPLPIASITKLMTAMVVLDAKQDMSEILEVTNRDVDYEKNSPSRLRVGTKLSRADMLHIALMSSENRAASALGQNFPGGIKAFVQAMNDKARSLGMNDTHYVDSTGLSSQNVASARDLGKLVVAAYQYPLVRRYSTDTEYVVESKGVLLQYSTSNGLVKNPNWDIGLQKTGYISEAGRCLVMQTKIDGRPVVMVLLDSKGKHTRLADAARVRKWLEANEGRTPVEAAVARQS